MEQREDESEKMTKCNAPDCTTEPYCQGYCKRHYMQVYRNGKLIRDADLYAWQRLPKYQGVCTVVGCGRRARGMCRLHKTQIKNHGHVVRPFVPKKEPSQIIRLNDHAEIVLCDRAGVERARAMIDLEDIPKVEHLRWNGNGSYENKRRLYPTSNRVLLHHLVMGTEKITGKLVVDHIDRNTLNCQKTNLRIVPSIINARNQKIRSTNTCGCNGVRYTQKKWVASIAITCRSKQTAISVREWLEKSRDANGI